MGTALNALAAVAGILGGAMPWPKVRYSAHAFPDAFTGHGKGSAARLRRAARRRKGRAQ